MVDAAIIHVGLGLGLIHPVVELAADWKGQGCGHMNKDIPFVISSTGL